MNSSLWVKDFCPECKTVNWIYWGKFDEQDDTEHLCEGITCWKCGHSWVFDPPFWREEKVWEVVGEDEEPEGDEAWTPKQQHFLKTGEHGGHDFLYWIRELAYLDKGKHFEEVKDE